MSRLRVLGPCGCCGLESSTSSGTSSDTSLIASSVNPTSSEESSTPGLSSGNGVASLCTNLRYDGSQYVVAGAPSPGDVFVWSGDYFAQNYSLDGVTLPSPDNLTGTCANWLFDDISSILQGGVSLAHASGTNFSFFSPVDGRPTGLGDCPDGELSVSFQACAYSNGIEVYAGLVSINVYLGPTKGAFTVHYGVHTPGKGSLATTGLTADYLYTDDSPGFYNDPDADMPATVSL